MTRSGERDLSRIGSIDYALMTLGSCLSAFSASMTIQQPSIGFFCIIALLIGATTSYAIRVALIRSPLIRLDGWLYALCGIAVYIFGSSLQSFMPEGGYPSDVIAAGWISWLLILGSFFTWQDSTLLFQAIPSIALFGLAGVYNTFLGVTFAFFGFLVCLAALFARAHRRAMLVQAAESGYFTRGLAPGTPTPSVETTPGLAKRMEEGPWRWIVGPEWAVFSALVVVAASVLGAPFIQMEMAPVAGFVKVPTPHGFRQRAVPNVTTAPGGESNGVVAVGQGPNRITNEPVFEVRMDQVRYLRASAFDSFHDRRWNITPPPAGSDQVGAATSAALDEMKTVSMIDFSILLRSTIRTLPVPGIVTAWYHSPPINDLADGRIQIPPPENSRASFDPTSPVPPPSAPDPLLEGRAAIVSGGTPAEAQKDLPPIFAPAVDRAHLSDRVVELVRRAKLGAKSDYEVANRIRDEVSRRIVYNINASAIPIDADPVDYVLFERPEAYCDMFATCMTLLAREAGIPARYAIGYYPEAKNLDRDGRFVVLASDYHAWSELYFKGFGWVVFDAVDGARSVPNGGRGAANDFGSVLASAWVRGGVDLAIFSLLVGAGVVGYRAVVRQRKMRTPRTELDRAYLTFSRMIERATKTRREASFTPHEFMAAVRDRLGLRWEDAAALNDRFVTFMYSAHETSSQDVERLRADLKVFAKVLRSPTAANPTPADS